MRLHRWALFVTCLVAAGLTAWLASVESGRADTIAQSVSAVFAVAAVGVAVWAALRPVDRRGPAVTARKTGSAVAVRGESISGVQAPPGASGTLESMESGDAIAVDGRAVSGTQISDNRSAPGGGEDPPGDSGHPAGSAARGPNR
ncbi:hypothetical protein [Nocardia sp. BMG51109]|uniref:hypothetical protein n=1 Tax=Nocardia sp. BMG51109 TaxID=1056816 RepID=UPI0012EC5065|nr:hypothetical protein [Nocardia sp. BMG51109]